ncbi:MFS general substrate transporter [Zopfia rhizophila CBS 207.26]|uniref:MFS general substrate transporter n=1 Tax=Zopfia rhizophila CBS 207.26 TaxID=1314779 RepID=A0A6A6EU02_9PEZI|nr:MFS general substrate transporter [Zopfia rhizophila CBS 207.26]
MAPDESDSYLTGWRLAVVITSLFFGSFLLALDTNIINVAIPQISTEFKALDDVAWYGTAYLVTLTAFQPIYGSMYKFFSTTIVYRTSILVFEVGSVLCAAAKVSPAFIAGRAIAGFGAAGLLQGALSIISQVVPLEERPMYMGIVISVFAITVCIGPPLGGVFTQHNSWRWCFWINLPIGALVLLALTLFLRIKNEDNEYRSLSLKKKVASMDPLGCLFFISTVCCLLLALQWGGQTKPWNSTTIIGLLVGAGVLTIVFVFTQWKLQELALIPPRVLQQRSIWTSAAVLFFLGGACYVNSFFLPFYFQAVHGIAPVDSGVDVIPYLLPQTVAIAVVSVFVKQWGYYVPYMLAGELICILGQALLTQLTENTPTVKWASYLVVAGIGNGMAMQLPYTAVQVVLSDKDIPTGNAIAVLSFQLGGAIAISMGQTISITTILDLLPQRLPQLSTQATLKAGAAGLQLLASTPQELITLRQIWNEAIKRIMLLAVFLVGASVPFTLGMEWLNAKKVAAKKNNGEDRDNNVKGSVEKESKTDVDVLAKGQTLTV